MTSAARPGNRLINETSPYLLQHAHNPVDWYPWGAAALARAKAEDKPILLSIGYAACHWCHVMERESFENEATAALMNEHFVCIKVDREERPDLDEIYMAATIAQSGSGGWPMTVFLTPAQQPFFAGTYFPPEDAYGRPGFPRILQELARLWRSDRATLLEHAVELTAQVAAHAHGTAPRALPEQASWQAIEQLSDDFDSVHGGFGRAPKFPPCSALSLLLEHHTTSHDVAALHMVTVTLNAMKNGGIYDHIAGGFARYSTDRQWLVPHFEKMLYDNAQLARVYGEAWQVTHDPEYRRVALETLHYLMREMQADDGGFFSATDADSEGVEGKFFVFRPAEIQAILGQTAATAFCAYYDITEPGNWEGVSIVRTPRTLSEVATELGMTEQQLASELPNWRKRVYEARSQRIPPLLDDKIITAWNGLAIGSMIEGYRVFRDGACLGSALRAAEFIERVLRREDGGLFRTARGGKAHLPGYLEDYAFVADAWIDLYEATGQRRWLDRALQLAERIRTEFSSDNGGFVTTGSNHEPLIARFADGHDGAIPNANAVAARALLRLSHHFADASLKQSALKALQAYGQAIARVPRAFTVALNAAAWLETAPIEIAVLGDSTHADFERMLATVGDVHLPKRLITLVNQQETTALPLAQGKSALDDRPTVYICRNQVCQAPITDPELLRAQLAATN
ncbi:MAG TPA: thioredoxin domain-containing protein [Polyangiaceae bacterium]|nr:thioredoxin domain-containing protein [Polyangiaceae bacterium]